MSAILQQTPLMPFGVELDLDLADPANADAVRASFVEHGLLVFRQQQLSMDEQKRIVGYLGPVCEHWSTVGYVSNKRAGGILGNAEVSFHSDNSYTSDPLLAVSLFGIEAPYETTSTRFASGTRALEKLPSILRERISRLHGINLFAASDEAQADRQRLEGYPDDCPRYVHPLIITDPVSGVQSLYALQMHTAAVASVSPSESEALLCELFGYLYEPENIYEHKWRKGDFVIWSNFRYQHARGALDPQHERTLQRVCISNGQPQVYEDALPARIVKGRIGAMA